MQYIPCNSALLAKEALFLTKKGTFLSKDFQKVRKSYRSSGIPYRHPGWTLTKRMIQCIKSNLQRILVMSEGRPLAKPTYICCDIF